MTTSWLLALLLGFDDVSFPRLAINLICRQPFENVSMKFDLLLVIVFQMNPKNQIEGLFIVRLIITDLHYDIYLDESSNQLLTSHLSTNSLTFR